MRRTPALRGLIRETTLEPRQLIAPLFVKEGIDAAVSVASMPGQFQHTLESLRKTAVDTAGRGVSLDASSFNQAPMQASAVCRWRLMVPIITRSGRKPLVASHRPNNSDCVTPNGDN